VLRLEDRLQPNADEVAAKVMDGEAIMINLSNGMYYSMDGVGAAIWELIDQQLTLNEIARVITRQYMVDAVQAAADVLRLADELHDEKLVLVVADATISTAPTPASIDRQPYAPPLLNAYRDMGDLLAVDPPMPGLEDIPWKATGDAVR
jgi:hypothetical protein